MNATTKAREGPILHAVTMTDRCDRSVKVSNDTEMIPHTVLHTHAKLSS